MKATRLMRRPFIVSGFQVTTEDMDAIAKWCGGHVIRDVAEPFIQVPVVRPTNPRQTEAKVGMWVIMSLDPVRGRRRYKVYTEEWVEKDFIIFDDYAYNDDGLDEEQPVPPSCCQHQHGGGRTNNVRALPTQPSSSSKTVPFRVGR